MAEKQFNTRIINKHDTAANWAKATNFIPKKGELIIYDIDAEYNYERIKLGDGIKTVNELEFLQSDNYPIIKKTGSIVTARSLDGLQINPTTFIEPVQSGSGDPSPDNVRPISGWDRVEVNRTRKNLLPINNINTNQSPTGEVVIGNIPSGTYTLSADITKYSDDTATNTRIGLTIFYTDGTTAQYQSEVDTNNIERDGVTRKKTISFKTGANKTVKKIMIWLLDRTAATVRNAKAENAQLEQGLTATAYEPYQGQTLTADLPETVYGGTLDWGTGSVQNKAVYVLLSSVSATWTLQTDVSNETTALFSVQFANVSHADRLKAVCTHLPNYGTNPQNETVRECCGFHTDKTYKNYFYIRINRNRLSSQNAEGLKTWLAENNVALCYYRENASEIQLTPQQLKAIDGTNNVWSNSGDTEAIFNLTASTKIDSAGTELGTVKTGGDVTIADGIITVNDDSHNHIISNVDGLQDALNAKATPANITSAIAALDYTGATASGNATSFITQVTQTDGVVSATKASIPIATSSQAGLVKSGTDITVDSNGNVSVNNNSHSHTSANISDLSTTINTAITNAIGALDASDPAASGSATQFITSISQKDGVITATKANITAAALGLSGAMKFLGTSATAITDGATTNPITIGSTSTTVASGNVVLYGSKEFVWTGSAWEELGNEGSYKVQQSAVSSPAASGSTTAFIDTISQNAQGVITATKKNVTFPTLSGGSAAAADATVVGGVTVSGHAVTVGKKTLTAGSNVTITGAADKITIAATDTTYGAASQSAAGLMSAADKTKLDGIATGANNYSLPTASSSTLGGVKIGTGIGISNGVISNSGVRSIATGSTNGTISVNTNGSSTNVAVKGLGSAAYKNASGTWDIDISGDAASASSLHFIALESDADLNTVTTPGFYSAAATATAQAIANNPLSALSTGIIVKVYTVGGIQYQEVTGTIAGGIYKRRHNDGNWSNWIQVATVSDNVASATQLKNSRTIDGVSFNGTAAITHYGECSTAAATAAKTVALTSFSLVTGARIAVKFTVTNTAANPTLNVNSTGAKAIMYRGSAISAGYLAANRVYEFVYDGTDWELIGDINTDTHYTTRLYAGASGAVANAAATSPYLTVTDNNTYRNQVRFVGSGATTVSSDANGNITISSTDNNTTYSAATQSAAGLMSAADKKKLDGIATGATANTGDITGVTAGNGLTGGGSSGSVTLNVGAGSGITVAADTVSVNTSYTTSGKNYKVAVDSTTGGLYVNVPWTDNNTDTKNTAGSTNSDSKLFLIGATSQAANPQTYSDSEVYTTNGTLTAKVFSGSGASLTSLNASNISSGTIAAARLPAATTSAQGAMTSTMVTKLNGIATGATADTAITTAEINGVCV